MQSQEQIYHANWPPSQGLTTHIVPRKSTILPISARAIISAPASLVWSILLDTSEYSVWNSFCPKVTIHSQLVNTSPKELQLLHLQTSFTFDVVMDAAKPSKKTPTQCRVTDVSTPESKSDYISSELLNEDRTFAQDLDRLYRIAWTTEGGFVARGLKSERFSEVIELADGNSCEFRTWECQGGVLARAVKFYYKDVLQTKFADWCRDLKTEAERRFREGSTVNGEHTFRVD